MWDDAPLFPEAASSIAGDVDLFYFFLIGVSVFFSVLIVSALVFFSIRYRRRQGVDPVQNRQHRLRALAAHAVRDGVVVQRPNRSKHFRCPGSE